MDQVAKDVNFSETGKRIVAALRASTIGLNRDAQTRYIYNEAVDDAIRFIENLSKSNPQHRMAYTALAKELRHYLPLRERTNHE